MIPFVPIAISLKMVQDGQTIEREVETMVAEGTGLAYVEHPHDEGEEVSLTLTHVPNGARLGEDWQVSSEQEIRKWIELLDAVVDWTGRFPVIRQGKLWKVLHLAAIGALHDREEEEG